MDLNKIQKFNAHIDKLKQLYKNDKSCYKKILSMIFPISEDSDKSINLQQIDEFGASIHVMQFIVTTPEFFKNTWFLKSLTNTVLIILSYVNNYSCRKYDLATLELLMNILNRTPSEQIDDTRICEILNQNLDHKTVDEECLPICLEIFDRLMDNSSRIPVNIKTLVQKLFSRLLTLNDFEWLCRFIEILLERFPITFYEPAMEWFFKESQSYIIQEPTDKEDVENILSLIAKIGSKFSKDEETHNNLLKRYHEMFNKLLKISHKICKFCFDKSMLRRGSSETLEILLQYFLQSEQINIANEEKRLNLPTGDLKNFYFEDRNFLHICHMLQMHSRLLWSASYIMRILSYWFYEKKEQIDSYVLKSMLYLYIFMVPACRKTFSSVALGEDLLKFSGDYFKELEIFTYCPLQLAWILKDGVEALQLKIIRYWLGADKAYNNNFEKILRTCKAEKMLPKLFIENPENHENSILAKLITKLEPSDLDAIGFYASSQVTSNFTTFIRLLLSIRQIPNIVDQRVTLFAIVTTSLPLIDNDLLLIACAYADALVLQPDDQTKCVICFTKFSATINFLFNKVPLVNKQIGSSILKLLLDILIIQEKNGIKIWQFYKISPKEAKKILTSPSVELFLEILLQSVCMENPLFDIDEKDLSSVLDDVIDISFSSDYIANRSILKLINRYLEFFCCKNRRLAFTAKVADFIKTHCSRKVELRSASSFCSFLDSWLRTLINEKNVFFKIVVPVYEIRSYVFRIEKVDVIDNFLMLLRKLQYDESEIDVGILKI